MRSAMFDMSRAGVGCAMVSRISKPRFGSSLCMSFARPEPKSRSSCTSTTVFAGLPAPSFSLVRFSTRDRGHDPEAGGEAEGVLQAAPVIWSETPTSTI